MSLTFSCILCRAGTGTGHMHMDSIGALGGSIVFCGCYLSSAYRFISTCVMQDYFFSHPLHTQSELRSGGVGWCEVGAYIFFISLQASWCSRIARRTFTLRHGLAFPYVGMTSTTSPNAYIAFLNSLATSAYRAVMIATCVFVSFALGYVPVVGGVVETIFFCWVDA
jgi:hypothetical protein